VASRRRHCQPRPSAACAAQCGKCRQTSSPLLWDVRHDRRRARRHQRASHRSAYDRCRRTIFLWRELRRQAADTPRREGRLLLGRAPRAERWTGRGVFPDHRRPPANTSAQREKTDQSAIRAAAIPYENGRSPRNCPKIIAPAMMLARSGSLSTATSRRRRVNRTIVDSNLTGMGGAMDVPARSRRIPSPDGVIASVSALLTTGAP
jgi:hypothetical protein